MSGRALALALGAALLLVPATAATAQEIDLDVEIPSLADEPFEVSDAQLRWGLNEETGSGAFAGGCNFLSAGAVGDTGGSKVWNAQDGHFRTSEGAVTITKPVATSGGVQQRPVSFADRCKDADGRPVSPSSPRGTGIEAVIDGGSGRVDPTSGDATISWEGSVTVVFYGGMTYWWFTDPVLEVSGGRGTLTATAGGYGTSRDDMSSWTRLRERTVVLAELPEVSLRGDKGFSTLPAYLGVRVDVPDGAPEQLRSGASWGSFPQSFVDFQEGTGQQAFWYSSGGARDVAKPATRLTVSYDAADPEEPTAREPDDDGDSPGEDEARPENPVQRPPRKNPAPPRGFAAPTVDAPPATGPDGSGHGMVGLPAAVPATTVLPLAGPSEPAALAATGEAPSAAVLALAVILLGVALTVVGFRSRWLAWPGSRKGQ